MRQKKRVVVPKRVKGKGLRIVKAEGIYQPYKNDREVVLNRGLGLYFPDRVTKIPLKGRIIGVKYYLSNGTQLVREY